MARGGPLRRASGRRCLWRSGAQGTCAFCAFEFRQDGTHARRAALGRSDRGAGSRAKRALHLLRRLEQGMSLVCASASSPVKWNNGPHPRKSAQKRWSPPPRAWKERHSLQAAEGGEHWGRPERTPWLPEHIHFTSASEENTGTVPRDRHSVIHLLRDPKDWEGMGKRWEGKSPIFLLCTLPHYLNL